jgi:hypothetical protein
MFNITEHPAWLETLEEDAIRRLDRNNQMLVEGSSDVLISPAMKSVSDTDIEIFVRNTFDSGNYTEKLISIEEANLSKLGPRSIAKPWGERRPDLESYFTDVSTVSEGEFTSLIKYHRTEFGIAGRLHPVSQESVAAGLESASAGGLPFMKKKGILKKEGLVTERYVDQYPCVIYTRTQEGGKTRNVMGVGISDVVREMRYQQAFLPVEKKLPWRAAIVHPDTVDKSMSYILRSKSDQGTIECLDFSAYDASVTPDLSADAFAFIASHFADSHHHELYEVYLRFATIPFYTPDGEFSGFHGVPSGSAFTNTIDSIVQFLISRDTGILKADDGLQIQGDDGVYLLQEEDYREGFISGFIEAGLRVNVEKSDSFKSQEAVFLQRYYHPNYSGIGHQLGGVYSIARALLRLKYLEKFVGDIGSDEEITGDDYFVLRAISILENCKYHPHFKDLVNFARRADKNGLSYTPAGLKAYERMPDRRSRAGVTNQYGDQSGIESFETVKLLRGT